MNCSEVQLQPQRWDVAPTFIQSRRAAKAQNPRAACLSPLCSGVGSGSTPLLAHRSHVVFCPTTVPFDSSFSSCRRQRRCQRQWKRFRCLRPHRRCHLRQRQRQPHRSRCCQGRRRLQRRRQRRHRRCRSRRYSRSLQPALPVWPWSGTYMRPAGPLCKVSLHPRTPNPELALYGTIHLMIHNAVHLVRQIYNKAFPLGSAAGWRWRRHEEKKNRKGRSSGRRPRGSDGQAGALGRDQLSDSRTRGTKH